MPHRVPGRTGRCPREGLGSAITIPPFESYSTAAATRRKECSPPRKPWVKSEKLSKPRRAKEKLSETTLRLRPGSKASFHGKTLHSMVYRYPIDRHRETKFETLCGCPHEFDILKIETRQLRLGFLYCRDLFRPMSTKRSSDATLRRRKRWPTLQPSAETSPRPSPSDRIPPQPPFPARPRTQHHARLSRLRNARAD
jgi:hypothetical protein